MLLAGGERTVVWSEEKYKQFLNLLLILAITAMLESFFHFDQDRGFPSSSFENSTSYTYQSISAKKSEVRHTLVYRLHVCSLRLAGVASSHELRLASF